MLLTALAVRREPNGNGEEEGLCSALSMCSSSAEAVSVVAWEGPGRSSKRLFVCTGRRGPRSPLCSFASANPGSLLYLARLVTFLLPWLPVTLQTETPVYVLSDVFVICICTH